MSKIKEDDKSGQAEKNTDNIIIFVIFFYSFSIRFFDAPCPRWNTRYPVDFRQISGGFLADIRQISGGYLDNGHWFLCHQNPRSYPKGQIYFI